MIKDQEKEIAKMKGLREQWYAVKSSGRDSR
jgi:hypothetical protein